MESIYLVFSALIMEFIDSSLGMMYGTILSPMLLALNYPLSDVIPSILLSQGIGGVVASLRHQKLKNADFRSGKTDRKIAALFIWFGIFACLFGVHFSVSLPKKFLNAYIGLLIISIGLFILSGKTVMLTNRRIYLLGFVSAFNKALSGGGFGPLVAGGQLIFRNRSEKGAIAATDFAEVPICFLSFFLWVILKGAPSVGLCFPLCIGAAIGGYFGPGFLSKVKDMKKFKMLLATVAITEGVSLLYKVLF
ncbi:MAG: sulfite exporter TauE/SafE family protein [Candidatus Riflebacteria bacterium]|nr:sulfite exporter TauE/SafE family protein [Candidatus Riflebacteria bacterium]